MLSRLLGIFAVLLALSCSALAPLPAPLRAPAAVRVALDGLGPWREFVAPGMALVRRGGVPVVMVPDGARADLVLRHGVSPTRPDGQCLWAGLYRAESHDVLLDPVCMQGGLQWASIVAHEILHSQGCRHVCVFSTDKPAGGCSPVGYGVAVLNPVVPAPPESCDPFVSACMDDAPQMSLTRLDRLELARARRSGP